jgi:hypothetical protein
MHRVVKYGSGRRPRAPKLSREQRMSGNLFGLAEDGDAERHEQQVCAGDEQ